MAPGAVHHPGDDHRARHCDAHPARSRDARNQRLDVPERSRDDRMRALHHAARSRKQILAISIPHQSEYRHATTNFKCLQGGSIMPAYLIAQVTIHDTAEYDKYLAGFMEVFAPFEGRVLVAADDDIEVLEGTWPKT